MPPSSPYARAIASCAISAPKFSSTRDRKSTRLNSSHGYISYAVFCLKKKKHQQHLWYNSAVFNIPPAVGDGRDMHVIDGARLPTELFVQSRELCCFDLYAHHHVRST